MFDQRLGLSEIAATTHELHGVSGRTAGTERSSLPDTWRLPAAGYAARVATAKHGG